MLVNRFDGGVWLLKEVFGAFRARTVARMLQPNSRIATEAGHREARHAALLDAAAQEFNARGIAGASIGRIAKAMGLTRAAVYYYVKDRDDLAAQCYRRSCEITAADLDAAGRVAGAGLAWVLAYIRAALDPDRVPCAVLGELDYFEGRTREAIVRAHESNVAKIRAFIRAGIEDGSVRPCDDEIVAQTLVGTIAWIPLSVDWVEGTDETFRARTAESLVDLIVNGYSKEPDYVFVPPVVIESFFPAPTNAFDRRATSAAKIEQLLRTASRLFNRRGIDGTSLDDITAELGATKGALYHYLANKTDLLVRCHRRGSVLYKDFADAAEKFGRNGLESGLIGLYLNVQAQASGLSPLIQLAGSGALPLAIRTEIRRRSRVLQKRFEGFGRKGLVDGSSRNVDFDAVAQLGAGAFEWLPKWFRTDESGARDDLAREIVDLFVRGLRVR
jgi:AcrR family transcriptional regulator